MPGSKIVAVPNVGNVEFPDSMSDDQIAVAIKTNFGPKLQSGPMTADQYAASQGAPGPSAVAAQGKAALMRRLPNIGANSTAAALAPAGDIAKMAYGVVRNAGATDPTSMEGILNNINTAISTVREIPNQPTTGSKIANVLGAPLGISGQAIREGSEETMQTGQVSPQLANAVGAPIVGALAAGRMGSIAEAGPQLQRTPRVAPTGEAFAEGLTNAINPDKLQIDKLQRNIQAQEPTIKQAVAEAGGAPNKPTLLKVLGAKSEAMREEFRQAYVEPIADMQVPLGKFAAKYGGETAGLPGYETASIRSLNTRLKQINDELIKPYNAEGAAQQAAMAPPNKVALKAEAAQVREILNTETGKALGVPPEQVSKARIASGQMGNIVDITRQVVARDRVKANNQPLPWHGAVVGAAGGMATGDPRVALAGAASGAATEIVSRKLQQAAANKAVRKSF